MIIMIQSFKLQCATGCLKKTLHNAFLKCLRLLTCYKVGKGGIYYSSFWTPERYKKIYIEFQMVKILDLDKLTSNLVSHIVLLIFLLPYADLENAASSACRHFVGNHAILRTF